MFMYEVTKFNARVLVVDDYVANQELTRALLELMDCHVELASNGEEALRMHEKEPYDLILMDIRMPVMDGYEASRQIRKQERGKKHTSIIAITANVLEGEKQRCFDAGMDDYLGKPIKAKDLENLLKKHLHHLVKRL